MNIEYELTKQDYLDFNFHYMEHSATIKRSLFIQRIFGPIIFLIAIIIMIFVMFSGKFYISDMIYELLWVYISLCIVTSILWIAFYPRIMKRSMDRKISKMMDEDKNAVYPEKHNFSVTEEGVITDITKMGESKYYSFEKVAETEKHLFIYVTALSAFPIPLSAFSSIDEKNKFLNLLNKKPDVRR